MDITYKSLVGEVAAAPSALAQGHFLGRLSFETDPADVYHDWQHGSGDFVLVDVRRPEDYQRQHLPGAINIPVAQLSAQRLAAYRPDTLFVVYCWGPGCNGSTKGAARLSALGFPVKEMIGGIEYWEKEGYPLESSSPA